MIVNPKKEVQGIILPDKNIIVDAKGDIIGHLFADGYVYNTKGIAIDKFISDGSSFYNKKAGNILPKGKVVDFNGDIIGLVSDNGEVIDILGKVYGKIDGSGRMLDDKGTYIGSVIQTGVAIGYDGAYLGYVAKSGKVIDVDGQISGIVSSDGHILDLNKKIIGEVVKEDFVIDVLGNIQGYLNALGDVIGLDDGILTTILPGGITNNNYSILRRGSVFDYSGKIIGQVSVNGSVISSNKENIGKTASVAQVVDNKGIPIGEIVNGETNNP